MTGLLPTFVSRFLERPSALHVAAAPSDAFAVKLFGGKVPPAWRDRKSRRETDYSVGEELLGVITGIAQYGLFVRFPNGESGLVLNGEICWPDEKITYRLGQRVTVLIKSFKPNRGLALSIKEPRAKVAFRAFSDANLPGTVVVGRIKSLVDYGLFITLAPGVAGLLHASAIPDIRAYTKDSIGQAISVRLVDIARDTRRISLELA